MAGRRKQSLLDGALILSAAIIAVKLIGVFFKLYVTLKIGYDGKGYYATAYNIYTPIYSIALAGLPTAVSKMVASELAQGRYKDVRKLFGVSNMLFTFTGLIGTAVMLLLAYPFAKSVGSMNSLPSIIAIAPSLFFCCAAMLASTSVITTKSSRSASRMEDSSSAIGMAPPRPRLASRRRHRQPSVVCPSMLSRPQV